VFIVPQNGNKGFGYTHFVKRPAGNMILDAFVYRSAGQWKPGNASRKTMAGAFEGLRDLTFDRAVLWTGYARAEFAVPVVSVNATVDAMIAGCTRP
jgi:hypothetical protein